MPDTQVDICVIEDDAAQRKLLAGQMSSKGYKVVTAANGTEGMQLVYRFRPRVILCDLMLPDHDGLNICRQLRADPTLDGTYLVILTAHGDGVHKKIALQAGADDFVEKPYDPEELVARVRNGLRIHRLQERLRHAALTDGLTGLWNHGYFRELIDREFQRIRRYGGCVSLLMVDLDHFKAINDTYGHETGNTVLSLTADHLRRVVRDADVVVRYGGEEFAIVCPETDVQEATRLAERLRQTLPDAIRLADHPDMRVYASIGVVSSNDSNVTGVSDLITLGDQALYVSKGGGRNRVTRADRIRDVPRSENPADAELNRLRKEVVALSMRAKDLCLQSVWALIQALEARDGYSAWHSRNVTLCTRWLARAAGWPTPLQNVTANAAMLHDLGKIGVPDHLLLKPRPLSEEEAARVRQVPLITCRILEPLRVFETETLIIRHVREHFHGAGYPEGLAGYQIPIGSRLLAVAEAFDSITCSRTFRHGRSIDEALVIFREQAGRQFDPAFTQLLEKTIRSDRDRWQAQVQRAHVELPDVIARVDAGDDAG